MSGSTLKDLILGAHQFNLVTEILAEREDGNEFEQCLLTGLAGCFTTLVFIAERLEAVEKDLALASRRKGEVLQ